MRKRVAVSPQARSDFREIVGYLQDNAGRAVARRYAGRIEASLDLIEEHPAIGAARPKLGAHIRIWPIPPYVLIYALGEDAVQILRILHAKRKITRRVVQEGS